MPGKFSLTTSLPSYRTSNSETTPTLRTLCVRGIGVDLTGILGDAWRDLPRKVFERGGQTGVKTKAVLGGGYGSGSPTPTTGVRTILAAAAAVVALATHCSSGHVTSQPEVGRRPRMRSSPRIGLRQPRKNYAHCDWSSSVDRNSYRMTPWVTSASSCRNPPSWIMRNYNVETCCAPSGDI